LNVEARSNNLDAMQSLPLFFLFEVIKLVCVYESRDMQCFCCSGLLRA